MELIDQQMLFSYWKQISEGPTNKKQPKVVAVKAQLSFSGEKPLHDHTHGFYTSGSHLMQRISSKNMKQSFHLNLSQFVLFRVSDASFSCYPETVNSIKTKNNPIELRPYRPNSTCSLYLDPEVQTELTDLSSVNLTGTNIFKLI